jgi:hypothetical protein
MLDEEEPLLQWEATALTVATWRAASTDRTRTYRAAVREVLEPQRVPRVAMAPEERARRQAAATKLRRQQASQGLTGAQRRRIGVLLARRCTLYEIAKDVGAAMPKVAAWIKQRRQ